MIRLPALRVISASALERLEICPASGVLPATDEISEWSESGTVIHGYLEAVPAVGVIAALAKVPEDMRSVCATIDLDALGELVTPGSTAAEVAFAFDVETGEARELHRGGKRDYSDAKETEIVGTEDVAALVGDDAVFAGDYKSGHARVRPPENNRQTQFFGLAETRAWDRSTAHLEIIRLDDEGKPWRRRGTLGPFELAAVAVDLRRIFYAVHAAADALARGDEPRLVVGRHCRYCPAKRDCKAVTGLIRGMAQPADQVTKIAGQLLREDRRRAYEIMRAADIGLKLFKEQLYLDARREPIPLDDGYVYGVVSAPRAELDGDVTWRVMHDLHGPVAADAATKHEAKKSWINDALRPVLEARKAAGEKATLTSLNEEVLARIEAKGGLFVKPGESVKEHKPKESA